MKQTSKTSLIYEGNSSFEEWLKEAENLIRAWGKGKVYYYATGCGLGSYGRSKTKLVKFASKHPEFVFVEDREALKRGSYIRSKQMALRTIVNNAQLIRMRFNTINNRENKLRASCGCSIFISDAQEIRVMLLHPDYETPMEKF